MAARRILYFTAEEHYLYTRGRGGSSSRRSSPTTRPGVGRVPRATCAATRARCSRCSPTSPGEDFHEEQIPFLRGADRDAVLRRRLAQRYRDTRLAAALSLGQVPTGRAAQRARAARLVHQHAAVRALARRARGGRRAPRRRVLGAAARAGARRRGSARRRAAPLMVTARPRRPAPVLRRGRQAALRPPRAHRRHGAAGARAVRALRDATAWPSISSPCARCRATARRCRCWWSRRRASARAFEQALGFRRPPDASAPSTTPTRAARCRLRRKRCRRAPRPRRSTCISRRASRRASSSPAAKTAAATWSGSCSAASSPRARPAFSPARSTAGARWLEALDVRGQAGDADDRGARAPPSSIERITATFPVTADQHREPAGDGGGVHAASPSAAPRPRRAFVHVSRRAGPVSAVRARRASTGASAIADRRDRTRGADPVEHRRRAGPTRRPRARCASRSRAA